MATNREHPAPCCFQRQILNLLYVEETEARKGNTKAWKGYYKLITEYQFEKLNSIIEKFSSIQKKNSILS